MSLHNSFGRRLAAVTCLSLALLSTASSQLPRQSSEVPYDQDFGPPFEVMALNYRYPSSYDSMKDIDFRNLIAHIFDDQGKPEFTARLRNGSFERKLKSGLDSVSLDAVHQLPAMRPNTEYELVLLTWFSARGSSDTSGIAQVFELRDHFLTIKQQIDWDEHFVPDGPYVLFDEQSRTLTFRAAHYLPGDSHCCVSAADVVALRWNGIHFGRMAVRTELSKYGKSAGKKI